MKSRTKARATALQALYEYDLSNHPVGSILSSRFEEDTDLDDKMRKFASEIVQGVYPIVNQLDEIIASYAPEWPLDQVASIDRNIIRIALWEFAVAKVTPVKVAINEAVELAKVFGSDSTPRFINGVLGSLVAKIEDYRSDIDRLSSQGS